MIIFISPPPVITSIAFIIIFSSACLSLSLSTEICGESFNTLRYILIPFKSACGLIRAISSLSILTISSFFRFKSPDFEKLKQSFANLFNLSISSLTTFTTSCSSFVEPNSCLSISLCNNDICILIAFKGFLISCASSLLYCPSVERVLAITSSSLNIFSSVISCITPTTYSISLFQLFIIE